MTTVSIFYDNRHTVRSKVDPKEYPLQSLGIASSCKLLKKIKKTTRKNSVATFNDLKIFYFPQK